MRKLVVIRYWFTYAFKGNMLVERELQVRCATFSFLAAAVFLAALLPALIPRQFRLILANLVGRAIDRGERVLMSRFSAPDLCRADKADAMIVREEMRFVHSLILGLHTDGKHTFGLPTFTKVSCRLSFRKRYIMGFAGEAIQRLH